MQTEGAYKVEKMKQKTKVPTKPKLIEMELITMGFEQWVDRFGPLENPTGTSGDFAFETYGPEYEKVKAAFKKNPATVWTRFSGDEDGIGDGFHWVNRLVYYITKIPANTDKQYWITLED